MEKPLRYFGLVRYYDFLVYYLFFYFFQLLVSDWPSV